MVGMIVGRLLNLSGSISAMAVINDDAAMSA